MIIREARLADTPLIAQVHVDTWRSAYRGIVPDVKLENLSYDRAEDVARQLIAGAQSKSFILVAETTYEIVAFASGGPVRESEAPETGEVYAIYVLDRHQRKGVGRLLVKAAVRHLLAQGMRALLVWVLQDNPARAFYERLGGQLLGSKMVSIAGRDLEEVSYGWNDMAVILSTGDESS